MAGRIAKETWVRFVAHVNANMPISQAASTLGMDYAAAQKFTRGDPRSSGHSVWLELCAGRPFWENAKAQSLSRMANPPKGSEPELPDTLGIKSILTLDAVVQEALADGRHFRERYFGRRTVYWQDHLWNELWERFVHGRATGERQYVVANMPPGGGKTTLTHDFEARVIVEDRTIRIGNFSGASALAVRNTGRLRRTLERATPQLARQVDIDRGLAVNATSSLAGDFGAFRPVNRDVWRSEMFVVAQYDDEAIAEKEPTVASFGFDQSYIGNRLDLIIADDMVDKRVTRNPEVMLAQREIWDTETETRLEPGGLLLLIGQRLAADDLYHYCLSQRIPLDPDDFDEIEVPEAPQRYTHIVYPAHDETKCEGVHKTTEAKPWPDGCLLDPGRLPWRELLNQQARNPDRYEVVYQQRDVSPGSTLVHPAWVHGGIDHVGDVHAGAWDIDRGVWQRPPHLNGPTTGIVTVDPSSTKFWACQAWLYDQPEDDRAAADLAGKRYLMDLRNLHMEAPELLGYNLETRQFYGLLEEWHAIYRSLGLSLDVVIVEQNHAQRFLLQYDHAKEWSRLRSVQFVPHTTSQIKLDPEIGVTSISVHWRFGRVRLPGRSDLDRAHVEPLVKQVTTYPRASLDDQVMANWFMEVQLPNVVKRVRRERPSEGRNRRPSWLAGARR